MFGKLMAVGVAGLFVGATVGTVGGMAVGAAMSTASAPKPELARASEPAPVVPAAATPAAKAEQPVSEQPKPPASDAPKTPPAPAKPPEKPVQAPATPPPPRWEYLVTSLSQKSNEATDQLNKLGNDGWEYLGLINISTPDVSSRVLRDATGQVTLPGHESLVAFRRPKK
jgi:hypothetical protein